MKLLYIFKALILWQFLTSGNAQAITSPNSLVAAQRKLERTYDQGMNLLAKDFCAKAKHLSEQVLKDIKVPTGSIAHNQEFKENLIYFLHVYNIYERHNLFGQLKELFNELIINNFNKDVQILNLLNEKGLKNLNKEYEENLKKFIKQDYLPKFEDFKLQLSEEDKKKHQGLLQAYESIKKCNDFQCYNKNFKLLNTEIQTPKDKIINLSDNAVERLVIYGIISVNEVAKAIVKDQKLSQLSPTLRQELLKDINYFTAEYDKNTRYERLYRLIKYFEIDIAKKYYSSEKHAAQEQQLLKEIFDENGYTELHLYTENYLYDLVDKSLPKIYDDYEKYANKEDFNREEFSMKWFENITKFQKFEQKYHKLFKLYALKKAGKI